jgi:hypothetical protein
MSGDKPLVAIATLVHERKAYAYEHFFEWARLQTWEPVEFVTAVHLGKYGDCGGVKEMRERVRQQALDLGADALMFLDIDTIPEENAVEQLLEVDGDMVTGIYFSRESATEDRAVCWRHDDNDQNFLNNEVVSEIDGAGMGCCLIHRRVFELVDWKYEIPDDDYPYWAEASRLGFRLRSLNTLRCLHYANEREYTYHPFGQIEESTKETYTIQSPDGVSINGKRYAGTIMEEPELLRTIQELDEPYSKKLIKSVTRQLSTLRPRDIAGVRVKHSGE